MNLFKDVIVITKHSNNLEKYLKNEYKGSIKIDIKVIDDETMSIVESIKQVWHKLYVRKKKNCFTF